MARKLTRWFQTTTPPVRDGVYERELPGMRPLRRFAFWDGSMWYGYAQNPDAAKRSYDNGFVSGFQAGGKWRGIRRLASSHGKGR